jgi:hypothetical protein
MSTVEKLVVSFAKYLEHDLFIKLEIDKSFINSVLMDLFLLLAIFEFNKASFG